MSTFRNAAPLIAICLALSACGGGAGNAGTTPPTHPTASQQIATGTLQIGTAATVGTSAVRRKPAYVSTGATYATLWIDSNTTGTRQPCNPLSNNSDSNECTINWTSTAGTHTFVVEVDTSYQPTGPGTVLAEASAVENLIAGFNSLPNISLNGVPAGIEYQSETTYAAGSATCNAVGTQGNCFGLSYFVTDATGNYIVPPGLYDDGGICFGSIPSGPALFYTDCTGDIVSQAAGSLQTLDVACYSSNNVTFTLQATGSSYVVLGATVPGEGTAAQLATYSLTYPDQESLAVTNFPSFTCNGSTITSNGAANGTVTAQSHAVKA